MSLESLIREIGNTDIYLLDQIIKGRINQKTYVLDAGCGSGRNLQILLDNNIRFMAFDKSPETIYSLAQDHPDREASFFVSTIEDLYLKNQKFDFIICNAVLHFAENHKHFDAMFDALIKHVTDSGILFIRMTSNIGLEENVSEIKDGVYDIPDGSTRYLLTQDKLNQLIQKHKLKYIEPLKTVNVANVRCMSTLVLGK